MGAGNNFLRCTAAEGGRERPCKAQLGTGRPRTGGVNKCGTPLAGAERRRVVPSLRTRLLAARSSAGPRSGHACDDISRIRSAYRSFNGFTGGNYKITSGCCAK